MADKKKKGLDGKAWSQRVKVLLISALFASIANTIYTWKMPTMEMLMPWDVWPALGLMLVITLVACLLHDVLGQVLPFELPIILYISLLTSILSFPNIGGPIAQFMINEYGKINLLPLCTPILSYAGISIGRDLDSFKKQGLAIVVVALLTFFGTFVGSAIIAQVVLKANGAI